MEALIERVAGLDVHQGSVVACIIIGAAGRRPAKEVRSFGAMRQDLAALRAWLLERGVTHVGMEARRASTGGQCTRPWRAPSR